MISLTINGKSVDLDNPTDLVDYLESLGVRDGHIAVAYNGSIVRKDEQSGVTLSEGDRLEIVRAVGGG
ncbi:MAG: sulfur carrier protein ThiS [SAR202 cluster bacterium]|jgi:sulfur carrier protein|nr:sulfur carrier protein ThiS [SAR202 cluster bacterium]MDP6302435.1 sulfur carrier protein ThiS [SAR202 cluster bacterium]MDP7103542.1 sulfur carrier protein ThiS [SAR202 cluster bacterium]MDP7223928.1 sulfur carrier protein ThiS [SAR202 cluster bacterium]MDP7413216.1 sulfur carrier protein ThiS [SAR202 cluster bacterium]|tara:strand:+ start:1619 stop:1822 length:204 start_codon:yes stop_codon:yes gene_type:complete